MPTLDAWLDEVRDDPPLPSRDAEVLSALGRLARAASVPDETVERALTSLRRLPLERYPLPPLLGPAWRLRHRIALRRGQGQRVTASGRP